jgi:O-antigen/teichoic acid export membrane protein
MDIDDPKTAEQSTIMLMMFAPGALFICLSRVTAIFYQYTLRKRRTLILFSMSVAVCPSLLGILLGQISLEGIALGVGLGPAVAIASMYVYVRFIRKEKLFDYSILKIG